MRKQSHRNEIGKGGEKSKDPNICWIKIEARQKNKVDWKTVEKGRNQVVKLTTLDDIQLKLYIFNEHNMIIYGHPFACYFWPKLAVGGRLEI